MIENECFPAGWHNGVVSETTQFPARKVAAAWGVHAFTMTGIVWACLAAAALAHGNIKEMWLWLGIALIVDGIDGTLARRAEVKKYTPWFDGSILDIVVDYLTWTFIPAIFMYLHVPLGHGPLPMLMLITITASSLFCYCNTKMKTDDYYFMGFPAAWNVVAVVMWIFGTPAWFNIPAIIVLAILTLAPITFVHPLRVHKMMAANIVATVLWIGATVQAVVLHPELPLLTQIVFWLSGGWIIAISAVRTIRGRADESTPQLVE